MINSFLKYTLLTLVTGLFFTTCKKYPENTMRLFQKPRKYDLMRGFITQYKVNGIDSLDLLNNYILNCSSGTSDLKSWEFSTIDEKNRNKAYHSCFGTIIYEWNNDYNNIYIYYKNEANLTKNIFIINGNNWEILKFIPSKKTIYHQLKLKTEIKGNVYEVQFN